MTSPQADSAADALQFSLNGESQALALGGETLSVRGLLERFELTGTRVAVAINGAVVPRSRFDSTEVAQGDQVEVIQAVGGG